VEFLPVFRKLSTTEKPSRVPFRETALPKHKLSLREFILSGNRNEKSKLPVVPSSDKNGKFYFNYW
jgi:hypothetical protein